MCIFAHFCTATYAQMAESVDALVSNTSGAIRAGSIPALGTRKRAKYLIYKYLALFFFVTCSQIVPIRLHVPNIPINTQIIIMNKKCR